MTLFDIELEPSSGQQDTDITLEGQDPVFPKTANMMFIMPRGGLEDASPRNAEPVGHWNDAKVALISLPGPVDPNGSTDFYNPR